MSSTHTELESRLMKTLGCDTTDGEFVGNYVSTRNPDYGSDEPDFIPLYPVQVFDDLLALLQKTAQEAELRGRIDELNELAGYGDRYLEFSESSGYSEPVLMTQIGTRVAHLRSQHNRTETS